jgi:phosphoglycolate phosphatase-like HAD superfamily hydrolase
MPKHLVWDWNGTLLNDFPVIVAATNEAITSVGGLILSADEHRDRFRRPIIEFYSELAGRILTDDEFADLDRLFHQCYQRQLAGCPLTADAMDALAAWPGTQSLLSMWFHTDLVPLVTSYKLVEKFRRVDGLRLKAGGDTKHPHLVEHLAAIEVPASEAVLIGDSVDDALAARRAGAGCVLYTGGFTSAEKLRETGAPLADSLVEAVELAHKQ